MVQNYARPLNDMDLANGFIINVLELNDQKLSSFNCRIRSTDRLAQEIMKAELLISQTSGQSTLESSRQRLPKYKHDLMRKDLREKIFKELITNIRLNDDDEITLGAGGVLPTSGVLKNKEAYILTGPPASGKSTIANYISETFGAMIIDSDYAKRKLPEYHAEFGPNIVHEESSLITFGSNQPQFGEEPNLFDYCISQEMNMVLPKIGHNLKALELLRDKMLSYGYKVHITLVNLDRQKSTTRALIRFLKTNRYVPLSLIFDCYGNEPTLTFYRTKNCSKWASIGKMSTDVDIGSSPLVIEYSEGNPAEKFK